MLTVHGFSTSTVHQQFMKLKWHTISKQLVFIKWPWFVNRTRRSRTSL